tara:strand:+ start:52877 stop:53074 length:198 start_codon:yes stop_codon:yes gene_type:complete
MILPAQHRNGLVYPARARDSPAGKCARNAWHDVLEFAGAESKMAEPAPADPAIFNQKPGLKDERA